MGPMSLVEIDRTAPAPFKVQVATGLAALILSGEIPPDSNLPTQRTLARELKLSERSVIRPAMWELQDRSLARYVPRHGIFSGRAADITLWMTDPRAAAERARTRRTIRVIDLIRRILVNHETRERGAWHP
jgi:DNA-binding FadR family transcriptional regulator